MTIPAFSISALACSLYRRAATLPAGPGIVQVDILLSARVLHRVGYADVYAGGLAMYIPLRGEMLHVRFCEQPQPPVPYRRFYERKVIACE